MLHSNRLVGLTLWIDILLVNDFVASSIGHLENICSPNFKDFQILAHFIIQIAWCSLLILNRALNIGKLPSWWWQTHVFCFSLKGSDFTLSGQHLLSDAFLEIRLNFLFLRKRLRNTLFPVTTACHSFFQAKVKLHKRSSQLILQLKQLYELSSWESNIPLGCAARARHVSHRMQKTTCTQGMNWIR